MDDVITKLQQMVDESNRIVFFGGAGVSTESGIPDFRSADGLYSQKFKYPPEYMLSHTCFKRNTKEFFDFYREKILFTGILPNKAHLKLAEMEKRGKLSAIVTQNIDGLHQAAGSKTVYELHGSIARNYCVDCSAPYDMGYIQNSIGIPYCERCGGIVKPDVVLYEEGLDSNTIDNAVRAIVKSDMLIIAGTSLTVYPAAGLVNYFKGKYLVLINRDPTPKDNAADLVIREKVGEVLDKIKV
ncbi:MAG TPA: NAD-dependent protein deacylase [Clostridia bacterium]|jgi:NAD-dependent deacetylase|nr:NAD-dependent protein deacylase [Clostridia bacterium]